MMQLPGIRDENRKKLVSEDHLGGGENAVGVATTRRDDPLPVSTVGSPPKVAQTEVVVAPAPSTTTTIDKVDDAKLVGLPDVPPRLASSLRTDVAEGESDASESQSRNDVPVRVAPSKPPTLPPRNVLLDREVARKSDDLDDVADEAGWGLDESENREA